MHAPLRWALVSACGLSPAGGRLALHKVGRLSQCCRGTSRALFSALPGDTTSTGPSPSAPKELLPPPSPGPLGLKLLHPDHSHSAMTGMSSPLPCPRLLGQLLANSVSQVPLGVYHVQDLEMMSLGPTP